MAATPNEAVRAAANSIASGMPSRRRQTSVTSDRVEHHRVDTGCHRPLPEQLDGGRARIQRRDDDDVLALDTQRLATRRQDHELGTCCGEDVDRRRHTIDDVLAVVDDEQAAGTAQSAGRRDQRVARGDGADDAGDRIGDVVRLGRFGRDRRTTRRRSR